MSVATLQHKISLLPPVFQKNAEYYVDFLLSQTQHTISKENQQRLDFSKYKTDTHLWAADAQDFVQGLRNEERF